MSGVFNHYNSLSTQGIPNYNDYNSASYITHSLNEKIIENNNNSFEYYCFNFARAITYQSDIILVHLVNHFMFKNLTNSKKLFDNFVKKIIETSNIRMIRLMYPYVKFLKETVEKRFKFIEENEVFSSRMRQEPFIGIFYDKKRQYVTDRLTNIEDIIDDYSFFEEYTGIRMDDPEMLDKVKNFLGDFMEFEDIEYFINLRDTLTFN